MSGEVLVGQPLHWLHGGDGTSPVRGHAGPGVAADVLQGGNRLGALWCAGVHAGLSLVGLSAVRPSGQTEALGIRDRTVVMVVLTGRTLQVGFLVAGVTGVTVVLHWGQKVSGERRVLFELIVMLGHG